MAVGLIIIKNKRTNCVQELPATTFVTIAIYVVVPISYLNNEKQVTLSLIATADSTAG